MMQFLAKSSWQFLNNAIWSAKTFWKLHVRGNCFCRRLTNRWAHYNDVIMSAMASQITSLTIVYSIVYSGAYQRKHQSFASLAFERGNHQWTVNSPHKGPVTRKMFPFDDVITWRLTCVSPDVIHVLVPPTGNKRTVLTGISETIK